MTTKGRAWAVLAAVLLAGVAVAINQFKVPPLMQVLMADLDIGMATGGWLMSVVSVASLILAIPTAYLLTRLGLRITGVLALSCTVVGSAVGALSSTAAALLLGRTVEGIGMGLIAVTGPATISAWFEPHERGVPMSIWATWVPVGNVIAFNLAHPVREALGWQGMWWLGILCALAGAIIFAAVVTDPPGARPRSPEPARGFRRRLLNPASWILALAFGAFSFSMLGYITWAPTYLSEALGIATATASFLASLQFLVGIPANLIAGWALDHSANRYRLLLVAYLVAGVLFAGSFRLGSAKLAAPYMLLLGTVASFVATSAFTLAPETMDPPELAALGVAIASVGSSAGTLIGPPALGAILSGGNWAAGSTFLVLVMGVGLTAAFGAWRRSLRPEASPAIRPGVGEP